MYDKFHRCGSSIFDGQTQITLYATEKLMSNRIFCSCRLVYFIPMCIRLQVICSKCSYTLLALSVNIIVVLYCFTNQMGYVPLWNRKTQNKNRSRNIRIIIYYHRNYHKFVIFIFIFKCDRRIVEVAKFGGNTTCTLRKAGTHSVDQSCRQSFCNFYRSFLFVNNFHIRLFSYDGRNDF